jgi:SAM-dependent methyltransferase
VTIDSLRSTGVAVLTADLLVGSVAIGVVLAALAAWGTHLTLRGSPSDRFFVDLVRAAADRYAGLGITAWEFARGKLRNDPVYRAAVERGLLESDPSGPVRSAGRTILDIGCGQGLMLALLAEARRRVRGGTWAQAFEPPVFEQMIGVETRPRIAAMAAAALAGEAEIVSDDARTSALPRSHVVLMFDVLHLMSASEQEALLSSAAAALEPGGVIVVREADASAGWRFRAVKKGNRLKALAVGEWRQQFHYRSASEWMACFAGLGLRSDVRPMGEGTPFGNVLFRIRR